jgi:hypothetical protein
VSYYLLRKNGFQFVHEAFELGNAEVSHHATHFLRSGRVKVCRQQGDTLIVSGWVITRDPMDQGLITD